MFNLADLLTANTALIPVSFKCAFALSRPICTPIGKARTAYISMVVGAYLCLGDKFAAAFSRTTLANAFGQIAFENLVFFATDNAVLSNAQMWFFRSAKQFELLSAIFRRALPRAHSGVAVSPCFKLFSAPFARKYRPLTGQMTASTLLSFAARSRAVFLTGLTSWGKFYSAQFARTRFIGGLSRLCPTILCTIAFIGVVLISSELSATMKAIASCVGSHISTCPMLMSNV
jgi:hypothetical protein